MFVDAVKLTLRAGKGGDGVIAWRREKFVPKGGPSGGDGGRGGGITFETDTHTFSLEGLRNRRILVADSGQPGSSALKQGKSGPDLVIKIPCGTLIKDAVTGKVLYDCTVPGQKWTLCKGGKGGKGNARFRSPTHQAPYVCTPGESGETAEVELELKLIADIGLIGMPNAGKSTLLNQITKVPVRIGAYPFTTLFPNLGYHFFPGNSRLLIADIPGIIEGAHHNKGLGFAFLKHVERSSSLMFVIDASGIEGRDPFEDFQVLRQELKAYNETLLSKPSLVILNKCDTEEAADQVLSFKERYPFDLQTLFTISAKEGTGLEPLYSAMHAMHLQNTPH